MMFQHSHCEKGSLELIRCFNTCFCIILYAPVWACSLRVLFYTLFMDIWAAAELSKVFRLLALRQ